MRTEPDREAEDAAFQILTQFLLHLCLDAPNPARGLHSSYSLPILRPPDAVLIDPELICWAGIGGSDLSEIVLSRPHVTATNANPLESEKGHAWHEVAPVTGNSSLGSDYMWSTWNEEFASKEGGK